MAWLGIWLVFGMLAAFEISALETTPGSDAALAVLYAATGVFALGMMVRQSVQSSDPSRLFPPLALSVAGVTVLAVFIYRGKVPLDWIDTLVAVSGFLLFSACAAVLGVCIAWREALRDRRVGAQARERRRLLKRMSGEIAELENPPVEDDASLLPPFPSNR